MSCRPRDAEQILADRRLDARLNRTSKRHHQAVVELCTSFGEVFHPAHPTGKEPGKNPWKIEIPDALDRKSRLLDYLKQASARVAPFVPHFFVERAVQPRQRGNENQQHPLGPKDVADALEDRRLIKDVFQDVHHQRRIEGGAVGAGRNGRVRLHGLHQRADGSNVRLALEALFQLSMQILRRLDEQNVLREVHVVGRDVAEPRADLDHLAAEVRVKVVKDPGVVAGDIGKGVEILTFVIAGIARNRRVASISHGRPLPRLLQHARVGYHKRGDRNPIGRVMVVHQLVPSLLPGDATGQAAIHFQLLLRRLGHFGELYADEFAPGFSSLVKPARQLRPNPADLVLYHHGIASPLSGLLLHLPCRRGIVYHNITPARFYEGTPLWESLMSARAQLSAMAPYTDLAIGVSQLNCDELRAAGHRNVHRVPLFVEPRRFGADRADPALLARLSDSAPALLCVGRVVPHKRIEDVLSLHAELLRLRPSARLWIVGSSAAGNQYVRKVTRLAKRLANVSLLGSATHAQLVAAYRAASVLVSMSEHEGFGLPLLEAMAAELPVMGYAAAAVPETLGGAGIAFTEKRYALLAELIDELCRNPKLRDSIVGGQKRRLQQLSAEASSQLLDAALVSCSLGPKVARRRRAKPKLAIVVQRFGDVIGGAEAHAKLIARRLSGDFNITVLTTCAKDHLTWANELPPGETRMDGIPVLRFPTERARAMRSFNRLSREMFRRSNDRMREEHWIAEQGPAAPALLEHISKQAKAYDVFIFFTYLYSPTAWGLPLAAGRAIVVPTTHDEPPLRFDLYTDVFERARVLFCNTPEEAELVRRRFAKHSKIRVVGAGIDSSPGDPSAFSQKYGIDRPYLMYVGRMEAGKGIPELLKFHRRLWHGDRDAPLLVLAGSADAQPSGPGVRYLGAISDADKADGLSGALAAVIPSRYESLSLLALEAFAQRTPILGNADSDVLRGQVLRSGAGATFEDFESYRAGIRKIAAERGLMARRALRYARQHTWSRVLSAYREEIEQIMETPR